MAHSGVDRNNTINGLVFLVALALAAPLEAGTGKTQTVGARTKLDFCVSVRFNATSAQIADIRRGLTDGSAVLLDATDGQFEFGNVSIVNNSGASQQAEVWIHEAAGGAVATYGKYGTLGEHINMYFPSNFSSTPSANGDAYTVAHEFAHHVWGLGDEYKNNSGASAECEPAPGSTTANFCIMDDYFRRGGNSGGGSTYTLNEFCVAANHDPDKDTVQESLNKKSCWQTLGAHATRPATAPSGLPTEAAPSATAPTFREPGNQRRFVPLIDRSGSMTIVDGGPGTPSRIMLAKQAANVFIDLTKNGDEIGVASFSTSASVNFSLTSITGSAVQAAAKAAVDALVASGSTAIGSGLIAARNMMTGAATQSCAQTIILFTDGFGNSGPGELTVVPSLVDSDISVISIAIGQSVSTANLSTIANATSGKFFQVQTAADLPALLAALSAEATGGGILAQQPGFLTPGATETRTIAVDPETNELAVVLTTSPNDVAVLTLLSPTNLVVDQGLAAASLDVDFLSSPGTRIFRVRRPVLETGVWTLMVQGITISDGRFTLTSSSDAESVSIVASSDAAQYVFPSPVVLQATPQFGLPVVAASVTALVRHPGGAEQTIQLFDDGDPAHGDTLSADGTYAAVFRSFSQSGSYRFGVIVEGLAGSHTIAGEELFLSIGAPSTSVPVPPFRRETSFTVVVEGVVANLPPTADAGADRIVECTSHAGTEVPLDGTSSSDPDGDALTFLWSAPGIVFDDPASAQPTGTFPLGTTVVTLTVSDAISASSDTVSVTVADTTPPSLSLTANPAVFWPPNHKLVNVHVTEMVSDSCDPTVGVVLVSVISNEPDNGQGNGDQPNDVQGANPGTPDFDLQLRAERAGKGAGRAYTLTYRATDAAGNATERSIVVVVPHDQGR